MAGHPPARSKVSALLHVLQTSAHNRALNSSSCACKLLLKLPCTAGDRVPTEKQGQPSAACVRDPHNMCRGRNSTKC